jgi:hypothetical protein
MQKVKSYYGTDWGGAPWDAIKRVARRLPWEGKVDKVTEKCGWVLNLQPQ